MNRRLRLRLGGARTMRSSPAPISKLVDDKRKAALFVRLEVRGGGDNNKNLLHPPRLRFVRPHLLVLLLLAMSLKFIKSVTSEVEWDQEVVKAPATQLCVCDIYTSWCGPCTALNKRVSNLSGDYIE